jgi:hypothetical protein
VEREKWKGKGICEGRQQANGNGAERGGGTGAKVVNGKGRRERSEGDMDGRKGGWTKGHGEEDLRNGDDLGCGNRQQMFAQIELGSTRSLK